MSVTQILRTAQAWADGSWEDQAACRGADVEIFFSVEESDQQRALEYCNACPVREACLSTAIVRQEMYGIWGGMLEADRRRIIREVRRKLRDTTKSSDAA